MFPPRGFLRGSLFVTVALATAAGSAVGQGRDALPDSPRGVLLDVPYIPQTEALCGGAAVTMVLRYWGDRDVRMSEFAPLAGRDGTGGILTADLHRATEGLGWSATPFTGDRATIQHHISSGRPLIALISVGANRFHYVAVVGVIGDRVVLHDPAISPYQTMEMEDFLAAWAGSRHWAMLVLPPEGGVPDQIRTASDEPAAEDVLETRVPPDPGPRAACAAEVQRGVALARAGETEAAHRTLAAAATECPTAAAPVRELAALELRSGRAEAAVPLARHAAELDPSDRHTWEVLAASQYLAGDEVASLDAWNRLDPVIIDEVTLATPSRTQQAAILGLVGLEAGQVLTGRDLELSRRRLDMLPAAASTRVDYRPLGDGGVVATAAVAERAALPTPTSLVFQAVRGVLADEGIGLRAASLLGAGELWMVDWRWSTPRRRIAFGLRVPVAGPVPGALTVGGLAERETYVFGTETREDRRRAELKLATWLAPWLRVSTTAAFDRWYELGSFGSLGADLLFVGLDDRASIRVCGEGWVGSAAPFARGDVELGWTSRLERRGLVVSARLGGSVAANASPFMIWPGAGTGTGRPALARAHRMLTEGRFNGSLFGRTLGYGGLEAVSWTHLGPLALGGAAFVDLAAATDRPEPYLGTDFQTDAGVGLRLGLPGLGAVRVDLARGLLDGAVAVSAGLQTGVGGH